MGSNKFHQNGKDTRKKKKCKRKNAPVGQGRKIDGGQTLAGEKTIV